MGEKNEVDIFGLKPYGESVKILTEGAVKGAGAFLSRICLPAAEEFGFLLRDSITRWRAQNTISILSKAEKKVKELKTLGEKHIHPRLLTKILQEGGLNDDDVLQEMWAGLIASSCTEKGDDDSNLAFLNILSQLTKAQATILNFCCFECEKTKSEAGWLAPGQVVMPLTELIKLTDVSDFQKLDRDLDHLRSLGLIQHGFSPASTDADLTPTPFALHFYARCQGHVGDVTNFYDIVDNKNSVVVVDAARLQEIRREIKALHPLERAEKCRAYFGCRVEVEAAFNTASEYLGKSANVSFSLPSEGDKSFSRLCLAGVINWDVVPAVKVASIGEKFFISGKIEGVDVGLDLIRLSNIEARKI